MTTERLATRLLVERLLAERVLAETQDPQSRYDWRIASSAPPGNCRLPAKHRRYQAAAKTASQAMSRPLAEATQAAGGRAPEVDVCVWQALIVQLMLKRPHAQGVRNSNSEAAQTAHANHPLHPTANRFDHQPNDPSHPSERRHPGGRNCVAPVWLRRHHPQADVRCPTTVQNDGPMGQDCAASVVDVNPCPDVTDVCAATNAPVADQSEQSKHRQPPTPREKPPSSSAHLRCRFVAKQTTGIPATPMKPIAAQSTRRLPHPAAIRSLVPALRTNRDPTRRALRHREAMADADLEPVLGRVDGLHTMPKARSMPFLSLQHQVHPGVDHLVTEGAFRGLSR